MGHLKPVFDPIAHFADELGYQLMPFNFGRIPGTEGVLLTNDLGEYILVKEQDFSAFIREELGPDTSVFQDLRARHFLQEVGRPVHTELLAAKFRTRKSFLRYGPSLHIFVLTLRCDHSCSYCQVSRQSANAAQYDISTETLTHAIERVFESRSRELTIEFQGGEPALAFPLLRRAVEQIESHPNAGGRTIRFTMVSTLHLMTEEMLLFCRDHKVGLSTSLDGPAFIHNANRPNPTRDSYAKTVAGIERARLIVGPEHVAALTTLSKLSLQHPREIIDTYIELGFRSIFLRPISPYGFAVKSERKTGYAVSEFVQFYRKALDYLIQLNVHGTPIDEAYTGILLRHILTPFPTGYVDLRSPAGAGLGAIIYNYDGKVYASDEGRMVAETGDDRFVLGTVDTPFTQLMQSEAMQWLLASGVAEALPGCSDCVFLPYCGSDPVFHASRQNDPVGHRPTSEFCKRHTGQFEVLFEKLLSKDDSARRVFSAWLSHRHAAEVPYPGVW